MFENQMKKVHFGGLLGERLQANLENWLLCAPSANPGMSDMFLRRDKTPRERLVPWYSEFPGKYITSAAAAYACNPDPRLKTEVDELINRLVDAQHKSEALLSPHPTKEGIAGKTEGWGDNGILKPLWELWGYYHLILGLLLWYEQTGNLTAFTLARTTADRVSDAFLSGSVTLDQACAPENLGLAHGYALLYSAFQQPQDKEMMDLILAYAENNHHYVQDTLKGKLFFEFPWPRWEALHLFQALGASKDEQAVKAMLLLAQGIRQTDRHNSGSFSSGECGCGDPYDLGSIETCCTVAWMALIIDCYHLTGESKWIDELELSLFNGMLGAQHPSGRWWTYDTPMDGVRRASAHSIVFQSLQGSPELNCCSVNGPRTLGMTSQWGLCAHESSVDINYYGESQWSFSFNNADIIHIHQQTRYPVEPTVTLTVCPTTASKFKLRLRIPSWSEHTQVTLNGQNLPAVAGSYLELDRVWQGGETINIKFDFSFHVWAGKRACAGKSALYRGPLLLAFDQRYNDAAIEDLPVIHPNELELVPPQALENWLPPQMLLRDLTNGVILCDFASAGATGSRYASWLPMEENVRQSPFSVIE